MAEKGSTVQIEYYPSDLMKEKWDYLTMTRNNLTLSLPRVEHKVNKELNMWYELELKSVTPEDAGDYRVDCGNYLGTTNTVSFHIIGLYSGCPI